MRQKYSAWLEAWRAAEHGHFALWLPVFMGAGVLLYFGLRSEPWAWLGASVAVPGGAGAVLARPWPAMRAVLAAVAAGALGFAAAQFATAMVGPLDPLPTHAAVYTGTIRGVEAVPTGRRVTLDTVTIEGAPSPLHRRLRVRLKANDATAVTSGDSVSLRAVVRPASPPAYPGAWDMQRDVFYSDLSGMGYALGPVVVRGHAPDGAMLWMLRLRESINRRIDAVLDGGVAALAQALLSGVMTGVPPADMAAFRDSGLAHLLSVSGLHIAIVMGIAVALVRLSLAAWPYAALRWPCKRVAVLAGLAAGAFYMVLTGSQVPMVRSFLMAAFVGVAMLAGRRALSMRSLAIAAALLILVEPDALVGASMQMSFAAVMALIAGNEAFGGRLGALYRSHGWGGKVAAYALGLVLTSLLAGSATLPFGAYHFGRVQFYFALSNLIAVPLTGVLVMPAGMLSLALMPLGWEWPALVVMGWGIEGVLWIAHTAAALPGATWMAPHMPPWGIVVVAFGMIWLSLWRSRLRLVGIAVMLAGLLSPLLERPPDILVSAEARLIAVRTPEGAFIQQVSGASKFTREAWLRYWGEAAFQPIPTQGVVANGAIDCGQPVCILRPKADARPALLVRGSARPDGCGDAAVLVAAEPARGLCPRPWPALVDRFTVWRYGATAIWLDAGRARVLTDRAYRGNRPWVPPLPVPRQREAPKLAPAERDVAIAPSAQSLR
ncbi:MAG TPA: ComEC/Rec2 family competence protein [Acetobacteraceae bacterium]|nr:ComEC/Rec2 family competence protein [Acetobacteraceae bacterium]